jgi:hypothetical protein
MAKRIQMVDLVAYLQEEKALYEKQIEAFGSRTLIIKSGPDDVTEEYVEQCKARLAEIEEILANAMD